MNHLRCIVLLLFVAPWAIGQSAHQGRPASPPKELDAFVESLYRQVVARHPLGIPQGANRKIFDPYLSKALLKRIELARSCADDWSKQNKGRIEKSPIAWSELGIFSGDEELSEPLTSRIERTESGKNGSFLVYVRFSEGAPPEEQWSWEVAAHVVKENGHFAIDDVTYLKGKEQDFEYRLSGALAEGCDGPRWVGDGPAGGRVAQVPDK